MSFIDKMDRKYGRRFGIPSLMIYITATMLAVYVLNVALSGALPSSLSSYLSFYRPSILKGEFWRIITFLFIPPGSSSPLFVLISLYFYYFIGNSLENVWGAFRFTFYYLCGAVGAILAGFLVGVSSNMYLNMSLFFAFAYLFPNHQVLLFFIIPIKVKYLGLINAFFFLLSFIQGGFAIRVIITFSLLNFFLFFGRDIYHDIRNKINVRRRRSQYKKNGGDSFWR